MYQNLLVALDLESPSDTPLATTIQLAGQCQAKWRAVSVVRTALLSGKGFFNADVVDRDALLDEARQALLARIAAQAVVPVPAPIDIQVGRPSEAIAEVAQYRNSDLIVIGAKPRSGSDFIVGTTATNILRTAHDVDIYACHRPDPSQPIKQILIAVDGSRITPQVLMEADHFIRQSALHDARVRVICVTDGAAPQKLQKRLRAYLADSDLAATEVEFARGDVLRSLDGIIRADGVDLLIIGSGKHFGPTWSIGSTTNDVLHEVQCDVLVIRPAD